MGVGGEDLKLGMETVGQRPLEGATGDGGGGAGGPRDGGAAEGGGMGMGAGSDQGMCMHVCKDCFCFRV